MTLQRILGPVLLVTVASACLQAGENIPVVNAGEPALEQALPVSLRGASPVLEAQFRAVRRALLYAGCKVEPLTEVSAPEALAFETSSEAGTDGLTGLTPEAAQALDAFRETVVSLGGTFDLKSSYRPASYQAHLHEVWMKWKALRGNRSAGCRVLREEVSAEFAHHQLLARQQPVPLSDHALGLAFDAAVRMPRGAKLNGKRVTVDKLAGMNGIRRPNVRRDPVHFKVIPERVVLAGSGQTSAF